MPIGWGGVLDLLRIAIIMIGSGAIVIGFAMLLVRGIRRAWRTPDQ
jgi:hypothetical protein